MIQERWRLRQKKDFIVRNLTVSLKNRLRLNIIIRWQPRVPPYYIYIVLNYSDSIVLPGKQRIFCHHGVNFGANTGDVFLVLGVVKHTLN